MGFGQSTAFGGPINMPTVDRLANSGLRYNAFHTCALVRGIMVASGENSRPGRRTQGDVWKGYTADHCWQGDPRSGMSIGPPECLDWPNPMSSMRTIQHVRLPAGAVTWIRGGGVALRASRMVLWGYLGSAIGSTVRSSCVWPGGEPVADRRRDGLSGRRASQWRSSSLPRGRPT